MNSLKLKISSIAWQENKNSSKTGAMLISIILMPRHDL
jgi:hypothetical protein